VQPTETQVQQSLRALEAGEPIRGHTWYELPEPEPPAGITELLADVPAVRHERMVDARMRLAAGMHPTDDDLASRMVGRLVCDRLR
jgi:hypothetical protein